MSRVGLLFVAAALACAASAVQAEVYQWASSHNTNWETASNWEGPVPSADANSAPSSTIVKSNDISAAVKGTVHVGEVLQLASNGILLLSASAATNEEVVFVFSSSTNNTNGVSTYTGGVVKSHDRDFECHKNWVTASGEAASLPPCQQDTAVFSADDTYNIFSRDYETHVKSLNVGPVAFGKGNEGSLPMYQYAGTNLRLDDTSGCKSSGNVTKCVCHTTCPDQNTQISQDAELRLVSTSEAQAELGRLLIEGASISPVSTGPSLSESVSPEINFDGKFMPEADISLALDDLNLASFKAYTANWLNNDPVLGFTNVTAEGINYELNYFTIPGQNKPIIEGVTISFDYKSLCAASKCEFTRQTRPELYQYLKSSLEARLALYPVQFPTCYNGNTGFDTSCLADSEQGPYDTCRATKSAAVCDAESKARITDLVKCGASGRYSGKCIEEFPTIAVRLSTTVSSQVARVYESNNPPAEATANGGDDALPIPIIAGAAGGGLVLIIIIIVIVTRRKSGGAAGPAGATSQNRSVVAFENPMYDDPASQGKAGEQPSYAAPAGDEGLYDEPAFNAQGGDKANPLYQSNEDLAALGEEEGGDGYLDVAPEEE